MQAKFVMGTPFMLDYTPVGAVVGGDVVVINNVALVLHRDIAASKLGAIAGGNGVYEVTADGAIAELDKVYWDDSANKVIKNGTARPVFGYVVPGSSAAADADKIKVYHCPELAGLGYNFVSQVIPKTANYTVLAADSGKTFTTVGAAGVVTFAMPAAVLGLKYRFRVGAAQELRIDPNGTETIALPSTGVQGAAGKYLTADADGETVAVECTKAGQWSVYGFTGTWTAEV